MADLIVVLDGSRVVEVGTHEELVAREVSTRSFTGSRRRLINEGILMLLLILNIKKMIGAVLGSVQSTAGPEPLD